MKGTCTKCKEEKALSEFYKSKDSRGYSYHCRKCTSERSKRRAKEIRAEVIDWTNQLYSGEELRIQLEAISKLNSKKLWSLRSKLNKLLRLSKTGKQTANSPSIDKIIPEMGYTKGNIQIISNKANKMKSDATPLDLILFAAWVLNNFDIDLYTTELEGNVEETLL